MKTKRILAAAAAAMLGAASLAGCGSGSSSATTGASTSAASGTTTTAAATTSGTTKAASSGSGSAALTFDWWGNQTRNDRTQKAIELYQQQNSGITIDGQFSQWADYWQKLATASAGGQLPDLMQMDYQYINQYTNGDLLLDLTPYIENGTLDTSKWNQDMIQAGTVDGKFVAACLGINTPALVYNKAVTDQAGVTIKDNMTIDEFIEVSKTITEKTGYKANLMYGSCHELFNYWLRSDGAILFQNDKIGATEEQLTKYFKVYEQGIDEGWLLDPGVFADISIGSVEQDPMVYGSSPETMSWEALCWSNQYTAFCNTAKEGQDLQMTTWPSPDPKKSDFLKPSQFLSIAKTTANPDEAVKFLNYFINSTDCNDILLGERGVPVNSDVADKVKGQLTENDQKIYDFVYNVVEPNSSVINPPYPDGFSEASKVLNNLQEELCYKQITSADAASQFVSQGSAALAAKAAG